MHVFLEVRDSVDAAAEEAMRNVEENEARVGNAPWFALRVAVHHDEAEMGPAGPAKLSLNLLAPLGSSLYWLDGDLPGKRYVPVLPSRSELAGELVPVRWAIARSTVRPGDVRVFDAGVYFRPTWEYLVMRANVGWRDEMVSGEEWVEAVIHQRS